MNDTHLLPEPKQVCCPPGLSWHTMDGDDGASVGTAFGTLVRVTSSPPTMALIPHRHDLLREIVRCCRFSHQDIKTDSIMEFYSTHGKKLIKAIGLPRTKPIPSAVLFTMEAKVPDGANARSSLAEQVRVFYSPSWDDYFHRKPRRHMSLQGFLEKYWRDNLPQYIAAAIWRAYLDLTTEENLVVNYCTGDSEGAKEVFSRVYATPAELGEGVSSVASYPSVIGSCMSGDLKNFDQVVQDFGLHPVVVYCTEDIGILWAEDNYGSTVARALVNRVHKNGCRFYCNLVGDARSRMEYAFDQKLKALGYARLGGDLKDCRIQRVDIAEDTILMPYIDGNNHCLGSDWRLCTLGVELKSTYGCLAIQTCPMCEGVFSNGDMRELGDLYVCEACLLANAVRCSHCDDLFDTSECTLVEGPDEELCLCDHCFPYYECCDCCGVYVTSIYSVHNSDGVCQHCLEELYYRCDLCEEYIRNGESCPNCSPKEDATNDQTQEANVPAQAATR